MSRWAQTFLSVFLGVLTLLMSNTSSAQNSSMDMVLVLDQSGSMGKVKKAQYYQKVVEWTLSLGGSEDRLAVVSFGANSRIDQEFTGFKQFDPAVMAKGSAKLEKYSDLGAGLEQAHYLMKTTARDDAIRLVMLFSDGIIDVPGGKRVAESSRRMLMRVLIPAMNQERALVFAFMPEGYKADRELLESLSKGSGGASFTGLPDDPLAFRASHILPIIEPEKPEIKPAPVEPIVKVVHVPVQQPEPSMSNTVILLIAIAGLLFVVAVVLLVVSKKKASRKQEVYDLDDDEKVVQESIIAEEPEATPKAESVPPAKVDDETKNEFADLLGDLQSIRASLDTKTSEDKPESEYEDSGDESELVNPAFSLGDVESLIAFTDDENGSDEQ